MTAHRDGIVTHAEVMRWLPKDVKRELTMTLTPEQRGWWTREEARADGGLFLEGLSLEFGAQYVRMPTL